MALSEVERVLSQGNLRAGHTDGIGGREETLQGSGN